MKKKNEKRNEKKNEKKKNSNTNNVVCILKSNTTIAES